MSTASKSETEQAAVEAIRDQLSRQDLNWRESQINVHWVGDRVDIVVSNTRRLEHVIRNIVMSALNTSQLFLDGNTDINVKACDKYEDYLAAKIQTLACDAAAQATRGDDFCCDVRTSVRRNGVTMSANCESFRTEARYKAAHEAFSAIVEDVAQIAGVDVNNVHFHLSGGSESKYSIPIRNLGPAEDLDDADDDDINPNWPSTTGNPSGGGRGNNPPRR